MANIVTLYKNKAGKIFARVEDNTRIHKYKVNLADSEIEIEKLKGDFSGYTQIGKPFEHESLEKSNLINTGDQEVELKMRDSKSEEVKGNRIVENPDKEMVKKAVQENIAEIANIVMGLDVAEKELALQKQQIENLRNTYEPSRIDFRDARNKLEAKEEKLKKVGKDLKELLDDPDVAQKNINDQLVKVSKSVEAIGNFQEARESANDASGEVIEAEIKLKKALKEIKKKEEEIAKKLRQAGNIAVEFGDESKKESFEYQAGIHDENIENMYEDIDELEKRTEIRKEKAKDQVAERNKIAESLNESVEILESIKSKANINFQSAMTSIENKTEYAKQHAANNNFALGAAVAKGASEELVVATAKFKRAEVAGEVIAKIQPLALPIVEMDVSESDYSLDNYNDIEEISLGKNSDSTSFKIDSKFNLDLDSISEEGSDLEAVERIHNAADLVKEAKDAASGEFRIYADGSVVFLPNILTKGEQSKAFLIGKIQGDVESGSVARTNEIDVKLTIKYIPDPIQLKNFDANNGSQIKVNIVAIETEKDKYCFLGGEKEQKFRFSYSKNNYQSAQDFVKDQKEYAAAVKHINGSEAEANRISQEITAEIRLQDKADQTKITKLTQDFAKLVKSTAAAAKSISNAEKNYPEEARANKEKAILVNESVFELASNIGIHARRIADAKMWELKRSQLALREPNANDKPLAIINLANNSTVTAGVVKEKLGQVGLIYNAILSTLPDDDDFVQVCNNHLAEIKDSHIIVNSQTQEINTAKENATTGKLRFYSDGTVVFIPTVQLPNVPVKALLVGTKNTLNENSLGLKNATGLDLKFQYLTIPISLDDFDVRAGNFIEIDVSKTVKYQFVGLGEQEFKFEVSKTQAQAFLDYAKAEKLLLQASNRVAGEYRNITNAALNPNAVAQSAATEATKSFELRVTFVAKEAKEALDLLGGESQMNKYGYSDTTATSLASKLLKLADSVEADAEEVERDIFAQAQRAVNLVNATPIGNPNRPEFVAKARAKLEQLNIAEGARAEVQKVFGVDPEIPASKALEEDLNTNTLGKFRFYSDGQIVFIPKGVDAGNPDAPVPVFIGELKNAPAKSLRGLVSLDAFVNVEIKYYEPVDVKLFNLNDPAYTNKKYIEVNTADPIIEKESNVDFQETKFRLREETENIDAFIENYNRLQNGEIRLYTSGQVVFVSYDESKPPVLIGGVNTVGSIDLPNMSLDYEALDIAERRLLPLFRDHHPSQYIKIDNVNEKVRLGLTGLSEVFSFRNDLPENKSFFEDRVKLKDLIKTKNDKNIQYNELGNSKNMIDSIDPTNGEEHTEAEKILLRQIARAQAIINQQLDINMRRATYYMRDYSEMVKIPETRKQLEERYDKLESDLNKINYLIRKYDILENTRQAQNPVTHPDQITQMENQLLQALRNLETEQKAQDKKLQDIDDRKNDVHSRLQHVNGQMFLGSNGNVFFNDEVVGSYSHERIEDKCLYKINYGDQVAPADVHTYKLPLEPELFDTAKTRIEFTADEVKELNKNNTDFVKLNDARKEYYKAAVSKASKTPKSISPNDVKIDLKSKGWDVIREPDPDLNIENYTVVNGGHRLEYNIQSNGISTIETFYSKDDKSNLDLLEAAKTFSPVDETQDDIIFYHKTPGQAEKLAKAYQKMHPGVSVYHTDKKEDFEFSDVSKMTQMQPKTAAQAIPHRFMKP